MRSGSAGASGTAGPMNAAAATRSGCSAASTTPQSVAHDTPTTTARSVAVASITASVSAANSRIAYASAPGGRSERPLPRPSNVTTRQCRAKYGICSFQWREWMSAHVGSSRIVGSARPVDLVEQAHAVALDVPGLVRVPGAGLLARFRDDDHGSRSRNSRARRLNATGSRACGAWPPPSIRTKSPPPMLGKRLAAAVVGDLIRSHRGRRAAGSAAAPRAPAPPRARASGALGRHQCLRSRFERPSDAVLDLLGRVRLAEDAREEELDEAAVVAQPEVHVVLRPALVRVELVRPREPGALVERLASAG